MRVDGEPTRTIWLDADGASVQVIDQSQLPHRLARHRLVTVDDAAAAISDMVVRGAPLIGATAAYGMALALRSDPSDAALQAAVELLATTRPTAVNLRWALDEVVAEVAPLPPAERAAAAYLVAARVCDEDVAMCEAIGEHGTQLIERAWEGKGRDSPVNVLTHCNAGWLATVDWGTATAPIYKAHDAGIPVHVWVDETRPRNQGSGLTAWELGNHGVAHTVVVDNAGGHLMQRGLVDLCLVGSDRTTAAGDVCNKIGTYLKALAAADNDVPFYVALPSSSIDWAVGDGASIPIEERAPSEVTTVRGRDAAGSVVTVTVTPEASPAANPGFDVTPARLVTGIVTERGITAANAASLRAMFPEAAPG